MIVANEWGSLKFEDEHSDMGYWNPVYEGHVDVVLENTSTHPIHIYESSNMWGYDIVRLEWQADGKTGTVSRVPVAAWSANAPSVITLAPGGATVRTVQLDKSWEGWPDFRSGMRLTLRAVYEQRAAGLRDITSPGTERRFASGWVGKVSSAPVTLEINGYFGH